MKRSDYNDFYEKVIVPCIEGIKNVARCELGDDFKLDSKKYTIEDF